LDASANTPVSFSAPDESPGFALYDNGFFKAGLTGRLRTPRSSAEYTELRGIRDIDWTVEAGGFAEFWTFNKLRARLELRRAFLGMNGDVADFISIGSNSTGLGPSRSVRA